MPRKSITLNGFTGGINHESESSDVRSIGDGKDELQDCKNFLADIPGTITGTIPYSGIVSGIVSLTIQSYATNNDGEQMTEPFDLLLKDSDLYNYMGLFSIGNKVNYSRNTDYQVNPYTEGTLDGSEDGGNYTFQNDGVDIKLGNVRDGDMIHFAGKDSPYNKIDLRGSKACFYNSEQTDENYWWKEGSGDEYTAPSDIVRVFMDDVGTIGYAAENIQYFNEANAANEESRVVNDGESTDTSTPSLSTTEPTWCAWKASSDSCNKLIRYSSSASPLDDVAFFGFHKNWTSGASTNTAGLIFRGGASYLDDATTSRHGGFAIMSSDVDMGMGWNGQGHQLALEFHMNHPTGIEKVVICAMTRPAQSPIMLYDSFLNTTIYNERIWTITPNMWQAAGCDKGFGRVVLDWDQYTHSHVLFEETAITHVGIFPVYSSAQTGPANPNLKFNYIMAVREFSTIKPVEGNWRNSKYRLFHSKIKNGVESLLYTYDKIALPGAQTATLKIHKPNAAIKEDGVGKGKLYYQELNQGEEAVSDQFYLGEWDYDDGWKSVTEAEFTAWDATFEAKTTFQGPPMTSTYNLESGYPDDVEHINARWKHAAVSNRTAYIGNIQQPPDTNTFPHPNSWDNGTILKTVPGSIGGFPDNQFIDLELGEDFITCMKALGDRLIVFTKHKCVVVNVAQDIEFLEDTFKYLGIKNPRQVSEMEGGLAIVNGSGVYYLDVNNQRNPVTVLSDKITPYTTFDNDSARVIYEPMKKLLWVWRYSDTLAFWSMRTKSWVGYSSGHSAILFNSTSEGLSFARPHGSTSDYTPNICTVYAKGSDYYFLNYYGTTMNGYRGVITKNSARYDIADIAIRTGLITCGDIGRRKKFNKLYYNVHNPKASEAGEYISLRVAYSLDKGENWTWPTQGGGPSNHGTLLNNGENEITIGESGKHIMFAFAEPAQSGTISSSTRLSDLTLIYREKSIK
tara:strand:+ start:1194 stop:4082 length:2889 start_codon:yes stop_codon:yes gene_type:complete